MVTRRDATHDSSLGASERSVWPLICWVRSVEKHSQERTAEPQISPLRSSGFPVTTRGFAGLHAALFKESRTRGPFQQREVGNPGTLRSR
jgi:hypothetical protein